MPASDLMGRSLAVLNKVAGSRVLDRLGLRRPVERAVLHGARGGFRTFGAATRTFGAATRTLGAANRTFAAAQRRATPERPRPAAARGVFDLTPTDEQQLIRDISREFAAGELRPAAAVAD